MLIQMGSGARWHLSTLPASSWAVGGADDCGHGELRQPLSLIRSVELLGDRGCGRGGAGAGEGDGVVGVAAPASHFLLFQGILPGTV